MGANSDVCCLFACCATYYSTAFSPARIVTDLRDAAISKHLVTVSSGAAGVAQNLRSEDVSDNMLSFITELPARIMTIISFIVDNLVSMKPTGEW